MSMQVNKNNNNNNNSVLSLISALTWASPEMRHAPGRREDTSSSPISS